MTATAASLEREEGRVPYVYLDSLGFQTIGVGRLVDHRKGGRLTNPEIDFLLANDIAEKTAQVIAALPWAASIDPVRLDVLVEMCFQLGIGSAAHGTGLLGFQHTLASVRDGRYAEAAASMLLSKWATSDSPARAHRMSTQMATGV